MVRISANGRTHGACKTAARTFADTLRALLSQSRNFRHKRATSKLRRSNKRRHRRRSRPSVRVFLTVERMKLANLDSPENHRGYILPGEIGIEFSSVIFTSDKDIHLVHFLRHLIETVAWKSETSLDIRTNEGPVTGEKILDQLDDRYSVPRRNLLTDSRSDIELERRYPTPSQRQPSEPYTPPKNKDKSS